MKAGLPNLEPRLLERWERIGLYSRLRETSRGRPSFVLHDGPPYANGNIHLGTALNKMLKDIVNRGQQMLGKDANYVPGWDCHGLPIEWKVEEQYRAAGKNKDEVPIVQLRAECRIFAEKWIGIQREEFKRLGVVGDWSNPYATMTFEAEARIVAELHKFATNGGLFRGAKPVMWSVIEKTGLAEAEVEYHDHTSTAVWVKFPVTKANDPAVAGAAIVIWTTTPWTLPGNRAIAFGPRMHYRVYRVDAVGEGATARAGDRLVLAEELAAQAMVDMRVTSFAPDSEIVALGSTIAAHPLRDKGYDFDVPLLPGEFVAADTGTGFVHIAPGHGEDDWHLGTAHGIEVPETVLPDGTYSSKVPVFAGLSVLAQGKDGKYYSPAEKPVLAALTEAGALLARAKIVHSYPHSWRSKAPLIFRTTPQWFIAMDRKDAGGTTLREKALAAIDQTRFVPGVGRNRLRGMIETRPDWLVSRQRAWGVPIAIFVDKNSGHVLRDAQVNQRIVDTFFQEGADAWFTRPAAHFLGGGRNPDDFEQVFDILDVWFESGCTHAFVLESGDWRLPWPADLYLEGSDQHRGWFHSSLLESCGTRGRAPYNAVLTHGFLLDEKGYKQSKSLGNMVIPQDVIAQSGADILRLWVAASNYTEDLTLGPTTLKAHIESYRRIRNTLRYLLGALDGFTEKESVAYMDMPPLETWLLHRLWELDRIVRAACSDFEFHAMFTELHNFCAVDLSAFYLDVRKDSLYCDPSSSVRRRAVRTTMDRVFGCLVRWLAPILCFTSEEAWLARYPSEDGSVHLETFPAIPDSWRNDALAARWREIRDIRRVITGALEIERASKRIGSSLEAGPHVIVSAVRAAALDHVDLAETAITSSIAVSVGPIPAEAFILPDVPDVGVVFKEAEGEKCVRCWRVLPEVVHTVHGQDGLCGRCTDAVGKSAA
jgi:isoleucyl-tRNA synthetase